MPPNESCLRFSRSFRLTADASEPENQQHGGVYRNTWQDTAKGLGIILVVMGHTERALIEAGVLPKANWHTFDFSIYTFHMPLFMFLAGLNVPRSLRAGAGPFLRGKLLTVVQPYVVWSVIYGAAMAMFSKFANHPTQLADILQIGWHPVSAYWFLYVLFILMVVATVVKPRPMLAIAAVTFVLGEPFEQDYLANQLLHFPLFFTAGIVLRHHRRLPAISMPSAVLLAIVGASTLVAAHDAGMVNYSSIMMLPTAICGIGVMIWLAQTIDRTAVLAFVGRLTMPIYVMHIMVAAVARTVLKAAFHGAPSPAIDMTLSTLMALCGPIVAYGVLRSLHLLPFFGLAIGPRGRRWVGRPVPLEKPAGAAC